MKAFQPTWSVDSVTLPELESTGRIEGCIMVNDFTMLRLEPVILEAMPQQPGGLLGMEDDWTGITSSAERRKVQNRLNQRAYRKRRRDDAKQHLASESHSPRTNASRIREFGRTSEGSNYTEKSEVERESWSPSRELWGMFHYAAERSRFSREKLDQVATLCKPGVPEQQNALTEFKIWVESCQKGSIPRTDYLLVLAKFNVFRGLLNNGTDLGYSPGGGGGMGDNDALSVFTDRSHATTLTPSIPAALRPTKLQRQILHHPWIDILPFPRMRDNLLRAGDGYDDEALCTDLIGYSSGSYGKTGMIIWGEPWDPNSWEVTESFVRYWGWTIRGCEELLRATNHWREKRGERPLRFHSAICEVEDFSDQQNMG